MKKIATILSIAILSACNSKAPEQGNSTVPDAAKEKASEMTGGASNATAPAVTAKKYDVKSCIVTYETSMNMGGMAIKSKQILYIDDFGNKECQETYKTDASGKEELTERTFVKDGFNYMCSVENKGGSKRKAMGTGVAAKFSMEEAASQKDYQFAKLGDETICGKPCNGFSMVTPSGNIKMYGWNHIVLKNVLDNAKMKMKSEQIATKIEENAAIPADKFEVPAGVKMTDM